MRLAAYVSRETYRRNKDLIEAEVGDDLVALEPHAGVCFGFNSVAATVWQHLGSPRTFDEIKEHLLAAYDVAEAQCATELEELLNQLIEGHLVTSSDS